MFWTNTPSTIVSAESLSRPEKFIEAVEDDNGDFYVNIDGGGNLAAKDKVNILFPTANTSETAARLSVDGGTNYYNIGGEVFNTPSRVISGRYLTLVFSGTRFYPTDGVVDRNTSYPSGDSGWRWIRYIDNRVILDYYSAISVSISQSASPLYESLPKIISLPFTIGTVISFVAKYEQSTYPAWLGRGNMSTTQMTIYLMSNASRVAQNHTISAHIEAII